MTQFPDLFAALAAPFDEKEVKSRQAPGGRQLKYITARTAMNRLDNVLGPENWWDEFVPGENSVVCKLTVRLPDASVLTKQDAGGYAGMADSGDDDKSGFSDAFKRACAKFGVARYLYRDGTPTFTRADGEVVESAPPAVEHSPQPGRPAAPAATGENSQQRGSWGGGNGNGNAPGGPPRSGKALFAWVKDQEQRHDVGLLKYLNGWSKLQDFPGRMVDWSPEQVQLAHAEATRKLKSAAPAREPGAEG